MTISGTVKSCMLKEHGKSARLELNERMTVYTLFDIKYVPAAQPGTPISFECVEASYKDKSYWKVVDGTVKFPRSVPGATHNDIPDDPDFLAQAQYYDARTISGSIVSEAQDYSPPAESTHKTISKAEVERIAVALEGILDHLRYGKEPK